MFEKFEKILKILSPNLLSIMPKILAFKIKLYIVKS